MPARKFNDQQEQIICQRYEAGESTVQLGKAFEVTHTIINKILKRNGIKTRTRSEAQGGLKPDLEPEVCRRYVAGESAVQLGKAFGVHACTIGELLRRKGIEIRSLSEAKGGLEPGQQAEVCRRYEAGESSCELGKAFGVTSGTITNILKRNGVKARSLSEAKGGLEPDLEPAVCRRYESGENTYELGKAFGVTHKTITKILKRNGIKTRTYSEAQGGLKPEQEPEVCRRYQEGENSYELAEAFGVGKSTIGNILKRNGIERRASGVEFGDSVQHALDRTGYHTHARECEFYLFELASYSDTHCKPGISFDADRRADEKYGENALRLWFSTRAEAFFLEQAVLDATRGSADCPEDLLEWGGATEVRAMPACDMEPIVLRLAAEMEELGVWDFASLRCPMTTSQRAICQQRAMAGAPACAA